MVKTRMNKGEMQCSIACVKRSAYGFTGMCRGPQFDRQRGVFIRAPLNILNTKYS
ncbi:hypothetical protein PHO31112_05154 [Pandoraea horticolens]|uniref:Uncharacterized protein n=1 Tax=Pandoraea horticolens TaxID=2508298 RepID=A0A5E4Z719_9BURK|nr:hypothetical protein PHO31112_05154 [Pandoraea horticolens]